MSYLKELGLGYPSQIICLNGIWMQKYSCIYYLVILFLVAQLLIWFSNLNDIHTIIIKIGEVLPHYLCNNFFMEDKIDYASCLFSCSVLDFHLMGNGRSTVMHRAIHNSHVIWGNKQRMLVLCSNNKRCGDGSSSGKKPTFNYTARDKAVFWE